MRWSLRIALEVAALSVVLLAWNLVSPSPGHATDIPSRRLCSLPDYFAPLGGVFNNGPVKSIESAWSLLWAEAIAAASEPRRRHRRS